MTTLEILQSETVAWWASLSPEEQELAKGEYRKAPDLLLTRLAKERSFHLCPKVVKRNQLDSEDVRPERLFRGVSHPTHAYELRYGEYWAGQGLEANGTFAAYGPGSRGLIKARGFSDETGVVMEMRLLTNSCVRDFREIIEEISCAKPIFIAETQETICIQTLRRERN